MERYRSQAPAPPDLRASQAPPDLKASPAPPDLKASQAPPDLKASQAPPDLKVILVLLVPKAIPAAPQVLREIPVLPDLTESHPM